MNGRFAGVIGWPVAHSYSPVMQEAAFRALGLDLRYGAFPVEPADLASAVRGAEALGFIGLNLTLPHKEAALALCRPDEVARAVGAVNTLVFRPGATPRGLNTDVHGFLQLLEEYGLPAASLVGERAVVLGAGGAARAAVYALLVAGAEVKVVSRSERRVGFEGRAEPEHLPWQPEALGAYLPSVRLLVDATPRGLSSRAGDRYDLELDPLPDDALVLDLVVRPSTGLVDAARARGLRAGTGEAMLVHQGARSLEAWTGRNAPVEAMRDALSRALRHR